MAKQIHQLAGLTGNIANGDMFAVDTGTVTRKFTYGSLAGAIVEQYNGSTIGGKAQTIKAAIDALAGVLSDAEIRKIFFGNAIVAPASGAGEIGGLMIYGKSVQSGTPSPSSPAAITSTGDSGSIGVVSGSKNLLRKFVNSSGTGTGATWSYDAETGTYTLVSTVGSGSEKVVNGGDIGVSGVAGATMTISYESVTGDNNASVRVFQGTNQLAMVYGSTKSVTFTVPTNDALSVSWRLGNSTASGVTVVFKGVQLEFGPARTDFAPIRDKVTASVTVEDGLPGIPVTSGGNYTDTDGQQWICDTIDLEAGTYTKRVKRIDTDDFTRTNSQAVGSTGYTRYIFDNGTTLPDVLRANADALCTHFPLISSNAGATGFWVYRENTGYPLFCFHFPTGTFDSNAAALAYMKALDGFELYYPLAVPVVTQLTQAQITALKTLKSYDGGTSLFTTDNTQPDLRAKIFVNAGAYI